MRIKTILYPLSRELDGLEIVDDDYDLSVAFQVENGNDADLEEK